MDPTVAVETVQPVDDRKTVDHGTDAYEFKEYDLKQYDHKEFVEKPYDYGDYGDYGTNNAKPTSAAYEEEFGPGVPAEKDFRESNVSGGREVRWWWSGMWKDACGTGVLGCLRGPLGLLFLPVSGCSWKHSACSQHSCCGKRRLAPHPGLLQMSAPAVSTDTPSVTSRHR